MNTNRKNKQWMRNRDQLKNPKIFNVSMIRNADGSFHMLGGESKRNAFGKRIWEGDDLKWKFDFFSDYADSTQKPLANPCRCRYKYSCNTTLPNGLLNYYSSYSISLRCRTHGHPALVSKGLSLNGQGKKNEKTG